MRISHTPGTHRVKDFNEIFNSIEPIANDVNNVVEPTRD